jgi:hypothetical protein
MLGGAELQAAPLRRWCWPTTREIRLCRGETKGGGAARGGAGVLIRFDSFEWDHWDAPSHG